MGHKHTREEILDGALATAFEVGLSKVSFGRVAKTLGTSDRVVVYYFPSKEDLLGEVLGVLGMQLQSTLAPAFDARQPDHLALARAAWPLLATVAVDPVFALFFEANGLAATGLEPFASVVPMLVEGWIAWAAAFLEGTAPQRRREAAAAVALLDGLLLLRQLAGAEVAAQAARALGVAPGRGRSPTG